MGVGGVVGSKITICMYDIGNRQLKGKVQKGPRPFALILAVNLQQL